MPYTEAKDSFIEGISASLSDLGLNKTAGQIYAYMLSMDRYITLQDIVEFLRISKGNASINVRVLEELGAIKKIWQKGDRKDYYQLVHDLWAFTGLLIHKNTTSSIWKSRETIEKTITDLQKSFTGMNDQDRDDARKFMQKLQNHKGVFSYAEEIGKDMLELDLHLDLQKLRTIWNMFKAQFKK
jgi:DNA-binding transcriptional regulator GbsR (MarR family)